jgi:hypothetical protein
MHPMNGSFDEQISQAASRGVFVPVAFTVAIILVAAGAAAALRRSKAAAGSPACFPAPRHLSSSRPL